jgi:hypothetical protein
MRSVKILMFVALFSVLNGMGETKCRLDELDLTAMTCG